MDHMDEMDRLSMAQELYFMKTIWNNLESQKETLDSPQWHEDILKDRENALTAGKVTISDWEVVKNRIKLNVSLQSR